MDNSASSKILPATVALYKAISVVVVVVVFIGGAGGGSSSSSVGF